ncbi:hypothetical protein EOD39_7985 [Acipenser ruthenus]|uniref:Uncharacterized protein n=1 Tax=Acipenser ruthenus TaxID=7906 RepID=A0A662YY81_ACIRT|nr:hypothetical protein EOD39_7985 [Acipenser ruthenus]
MKKYLQGPGIEGFEEVLLLLWELVDGIWGPGDEKEHRLRYCECLAAFLRQAAAVNLNHQLPHLSLVSSKICAQIREGKDVNLVLLLLSSLEVYANRILDSSEVFVILKSKGPHLFKKLTLSEFVTD